ncbi:MAG TPA: ZIP family metal transporter [Nitrososphaeraceae archaeon]|nr:ZIP family metal transporter [Nitrososphaeraceae archaeon]HJY14881.1 ZIP family metal transporter [Nitrososphaeraceae archaeon]
MRSKGLRGRGREVGEENDANGNKEERKVNSFYKKLSYKKRIVAAAFIPFIVLAVMIFLLFSPSFQSFLNSGIPLPEVTIEKVEFRENPSQIIAFIRNTGPAEITIAHADINDRIHAAAIEPSKTLARLSDAKIMIPFSWNAAEPYEVGVTTADGTRFSKTIEAAAPAPNPDSKQIALFAIIGTYVGIIPVMIGLLWYPFIRSMSKNKYNFFLSLTAGLLVFLGIDAIIESNEIAIENVSSVFNGQMLIVIVTSISFIALLYTSEKLTQKAIKKSVSSSATKITTNYSSYSDSIATNSPYTRSQQSQEQQQLQQQLLKPLAISLMIAIGIGLHNFGEGLAIGAAVLLGEIALSTFLIIGFTLHNTTEGLAIVAPIAKSKQLMLRRLVLMGMIAGAPTIAGAWIGGFLYSPIATIIFLSIGSGAIFQVVYSIGSWMLRTIEYNSDDNDNKNKTIASMNKFTIAGFVVGMVIMYVTSLLV